MTFSVPLLKFLLLDCFLFRDHIIARNENSLEKLILRERIHTLDLMDEIRFTVFLGPIILLLKQLLSQLLLPIIRDHKFVLLAGWGALRVHILVFFFVQNVEALLCLPALLIL